jgi:hypothetical protein
VLRRAVALYNAKNWKKIGASPRTAAARRYAARRGQKHPAWAAGLGRLARRRERASRHAAPHRAATRRHAHAARPPAAEFFADRSDVQCLHRWQKVLNPDLVKGPWTQQVRPGAPCWQLLCSACEIATRRAARGARRAIVLQP